MDLSYVFKGSELRLSQVTHEVYYRSVINGQRKSNCLEGATVALGQLFELLNEGVLKITCHREKVTRFLRAVLPLVSARPIPVSHFKAGELIVCLVKTLKSFNILIWHATF